MAVVVPLKLTHPDWCHLPSCTAYSMEDDVERRRHRTAPRIIPKTIGDETCYLHIGSDPSGTDQYLEIAELLDKEDTVWWHANGVRNEMVMPLARAATISQEIIGLLSEAVPANALPMQQAG